MKNSRTNPGQMQNMGQIPGLSRISRTNCQIPGFPGFPGRVATMPAWVCYMGVLHGCAIFLKYSCLLQKFFKYMSRVIFQNIKQVGLVSK